MALNRYIAEQDTTIANAFQPNLLYRSTGSNMGAADSMEIFAIYAQASTSSQELSRALVQFPVDEISTDRTSGIIPVSGSVDFYLRMYNAEHPFTVPKKITLAICPVSQSWDEGYGLDCDEYTDKGYCNWIVASSGSAGLTNWTNQGGDFYTGSYVPASSLPIYSYYMEEGTENISLDITSLIEEWIANTKPNYGVGIFLTSSIENAVSSSYTKKFYTRSSEYFFKRPYIEARWDDSKKDSRASFYASSSLVGIENVNTLYLYNFMRGKFVNIPSAGTGAIYLKMHTDSVSGSDLSATPITGGYYTLGIYTASFALNTTSSHIWDRWYVSGSTGTASYVHTGSMISVNSFAASSYNPNPQYVLTMPHLKSEYNNIEAVRLDVVTRQKGWSPNRYVVMQSDPELQIIEDLYYNIKRVTDNLEVVEFGTGSINHTRLSYDVSGSYFILNFDLLQPDYMYEFGFCRKVEENHFEELPSKFRFRVVELV